VEGRPKLLWAYPMAITVEEALAKIAAGSPSGRARYTKVLPPPEPFDLDPVQYAKNLKRWAREARASR
jgi:hypothetical protein